MTSTVATESLARSTEAQLYAAIAQAQAHANAVEKDATNTFHKYRYASAESLIAESKECLAFAKLGVIPLTSTITPLDKSLGDVTSKDGRVSTGAIAKLTARWLVVHEAGGSLELSIEWPVVPESGRPVDKAVAAAHTASLGYLLRDLLQLPRVEEGTNLDDNSRDEDRRIEDKRKEMEAAKAAAMAGNRRPTPAAAAAATTAAPTVDEEMRVKNAVRAELLKRGFNEPARQVAEVARLNGGKPPEGIDRWKAILAMFSDPAKAAA